MFAALPFAIWFYLGIEQVPLAAEEAHDSVNDVPRALTWGIATVLALSVFVLVLNSGVGGGAVECIRRRDDGDFVAALMARERKVSGKLAHLLDTDLARVLDELHSDEIRVLGACDAPAGCALAAGRMSRIRAQDELCHPVRQDIAARAARFVDEKCVGKTPRRKRSPQQRLLRLKPR